MPRKVFVAGEILTASDVNTNLMDQSVMVFDDASARTTAIPTPVEGMVTYLKDTDLVEKFDGDDFVNVSPPGLIQVKSVVRTSVFSASLAAGASTPITSFSITHAVANATNKVLLMTQIGMTGNSDSSRATGVFFAEDGTALNIGDASGTFQRVSAGLNGAVFAGSGSAGLGYSLSFLHTPGAGSKTYTVRILNVDNGGNTVFVNRGGAESGDARTARGSSTFTLMEVAG